MQNVLCGIKYYIQCHNLQILEMVKTSKERMAEHRSKVYNDPEAYAKIKIEGQNQKAEEEAD